MVPWLAYPACTILKFEKLLLCEASYLHGTKYIAW